MTYAAPSCDFYDDGLVHSHQWARNVAPGGKPGDDRSGHSTSPTRYEHDDGLVHEHRWART
jgi:hypothetical protein